jgi:hypothetical protein
LCGSRTPLRRRSAVLWFGPNHHKMATCPRCKGFLSDNHKCPRRRLFVASEIVLAGVAGGFAALLIVALIDPQGRLTNVDGSAVIIGALSGIGLDRYFRG